MFLISSLKATVHVCTACMVVSLLTTCVHLNTPPLAQIAPFHARFASQTRKKARLPSGSVQASECRSVYHHSLVLKKRVLSLSLTVILARHWSLIGLSKLFAKSGDPSVFTQKRVACCSCFAPCSCVALALLIAVMIHSSREVPQTFPPSLGFTQFVHPSRCSRSILTTVFFCFCFCASLSESAASAPHPSSAHIGFATPSPEPSQAKTFHPVVECGIHGLVEYRSCNLNNIVVLEQ